MRKKGLVIFAAVVVLQLGGMYALDRYLAPASNGSTASAAPVSAATEASAVTPPANALLYDRADQSGMVAYFDNNDRLVIKNKSNQVVALQSLPGVHFLQWLDNGMTLLYVRDIYGRNEVGVFQTADQSLVPLHDIPSDNVQVDQVYKSVYSQTIDMIYHQDGKLYVASYEAIFGWKQRSLSYYGFNLQDSWLDDKADTLYLRDQNQQVWHFRNGTLYNDKNVALFGQADSGPNTNPMTTPGKSALQK